MPGDVRLTDAVVLLGAARDSVADYIDGIESRRGVSDPAVNAHAANLLRLNTSAEQFLRRLIDTNGAIVSSGCSNAMEISDAKRRGDFLVLDDGLGLILRLKGWRERAEAALHQEIYR
jgi:hypothetical protein